MNAKLSIGLLATLGVPILLASALAQQQASDDSSPQSRRTTGTVRVGTIVPAQSSSSTGVSDDVSPRIAGDASEPATLPITHDETSHGSIYIFPTDPRRTEETNLARVADELAKKLGGAKSDTDRSQIKTQLSEALEKQFDLRQKRHQEEIAGLEAKVKKLKGLVGKRQENRREIVSKRLDQILSNAEGLGW
jgi:hypothetical protein